MACAIAAAGRRPGQPGADRAARLGAIVDSRGARRGPRRRRRARARLRAASPACRVVDIAHARRTPRRRTGVRHPWRRIGTGRRPGDDPAHLGNHRRAKGVVVDQRSLQPNALSWIADVNRRPRHSLPQRGPALPRQRRHRPGPPRRGRHRLCPGEASPHRVAWPPWSDGGSSRPFSCRPWSGCCSTPGAWTVPTSSALTLLLHGAAPMPAELADRARKRLGVDLQTIFGITEGGGPVLSLRADDPSRSPAGARRGLRRYRHARHRGADHRRRGSAGRAPAPSENSRSPATG